MTGGERTGPEPVAALPDLVAERWLDADVEHGEGVVWDAEAGRLRFVDIPRGRVFEVDPGDPSHVRRVDLPAPVTAVHPTVEPGTLVVADGEGMALVRDGALAERLAAPLAGRPEIRMNDGNVDPAGRYFAGSMAYDATPGAASLYRLDPDRSLYTVLTGLTISNGIGWSPDATLCYFVDTPTRRIDVFDYDRTTGELAGRRTFADVAGIPGVPDGLTVDADGHVWVAFYAGSRVCAFTPDGTLEQVVRLPVSQVTSCCFGGERLDELFVTTSTEKLSPAQLADQPGAGAVFRCVPGRRGRPSNRFAL